MRPRNAGGGGVEAFFTFLRMVENDGEKLSWRKISLRLSLLSEMQLFPQLSGKRKKNSREKKIRIWKETGNRFHFPFSSRHFFSLSFPVENPLEPKLVAYLAHGRSACFKWYWRKEAGGEKKRMWWKVPRSNKTGSNFISDSFFDLPFLHLFLFAQSSQIRGVTRVGTRLGFHTFLGKGEKANLTKTLNEKGNTTGRLAYYDCSLYME